MRTTEEPWRIHEQRGAACRLKGDAPGCAQAYYEAARADRFLRSQREHVSSYLFALHYLPGISAEELARQHFVYGKLYQEELAENEAAAEHAVVLPTSSSTSALPTPHRLRIGFLAPDFLESSSARFYEALLDLPRDAFDVFAYSLSDEVDAFTQRVQSMVSCYAVLSTYDLAAAEQAIAKDDLDILVDLGGHTAGGMTLMLLAHHPARVIIEAVGWFDTTGLPTIDYLLTDDIMDPPGREALLSEQPLRLPHAWCFTSSKAMQAARAEQAPRHSFSPVRLASFQNFLKISDDVLDTWRAILDRAPHAVLHLQDTMRVPARVTELERRLRAAGFPMDHVTVAMGEDDYLSALAQQDLVLDTFPYPGGAMTATALYLGVPVLTLAGNSHSRSIGASILTAAGLPDLIAPDSAQYIKTAVALVNRPTELSNLQTYIWNNVLQSLLCKVETYRASWIQRLHLLGAVSRKVDGEGSRVV